MHVCGLQFGVFIDGTLSVGVIGAEFVFCRIVLVMSTPSVRSQGAVADESADEARGKNRATRKAAAEVRNVKRKTIVDEDDPDERLLQLFRKRIGVAAACLGKSESRIKDEARQDFVRQNYRYRSWRERCGTPVWKSSL